MFGIFKKKSTKAAAAVEVAVKLLQVQIALGDAEDNDVFSERLIDPYSRGYIFGLCDALLQSSGVKDEMEAMALLTIVHVKLFGNDHGATMVGQSFRNQDQPEFDKGRMRGSQELFEYFRSEAKTPAMGLAGYLLNGEK